jgi:uncharacterized protein YjiS (DUF1127 family)
MTAFWDWPNTRHYGVAKPRDKAGRRSGLCIGAVKLLRLWRERHRQRQELVMLSMRDLRDTGVARELVEHEARKWPWQSWHPQLSALEEAARRRSLGQR